MFFAFTMISDTGFFVADDAGKRMLDKWILEAFRKENLIPTLRQVQSQAREYPR